MWEHGGLYLLIGLNNNQFSESSMVMKKVLSVFISFTIAYVFCLSSYSISADEKINVFNAPTEKIAMEILSKDEDTYKTSLTENEFVQELNKQGFSVEKKVTRKAYDGKAKATGYIIRKPLRRNAARKNSGYIPGNHYVITTYSSFNGWNYFVSFIGAGVELKSSPYGKESEDSDIQQTHGGQGVS